MDAYTPGVEGHEDKIQVYFAGNQDPAKLTASVNTMIDAILGRNGTVEEIRHGTETVGYGLHFTVVVFYRIPR